MPTPRKHDRSGFKLYLEGIEVPFTAIRIEESEGAFPSATVQIPATLKCLKVLPGTIVQLSGNQILSTHVAQQLKSKSKDVLLFEGEVNTIAYSKEAQGRSLQLECTSLLNRVTTAKAIAADSIAPKLHRDSQMVVQNVDASTGSNSPLNNQPKSPRISDSDAENELILVDRHGGIQGSAIQAIEDIIPSGNINRIVERLLEFFNKTDYYFHILDVSFRLKSSITAFPNKQEEALSGILQKALTNLLGKMKSGTTETETYNLYSVL